MPIKALKEYQTQAIDSAVDVLTTAQRLLDAAGNDLQGRKTAIHEYGYLLIEAPTGSGKTLIAGHVVERMSTADRVVWFWFAPFKGVVEQTASTLREEFTTLRVRELSEDRDVIGTQTGDVFVTTWQSVATRMKDNRSIRQSGEQNPSVDDMILSLREQGFRIGVVVDEAHHGFHGEAQAGIFFKGVLEPEYTVLVTATPDDEDIKDMQRKMHLGKLHRIAISRNDAYAQGLIKKGIRCIAWRAEEGSAALVDLEKTALREALVIQKALKAELSAAKINLVPLILVQVASRDAAVEEAKQKLIELGMRPDQIATHTAKEPDPNLLALANDESKEVLIFKMSVALGFDAPRAWTLVSTRPAHDVDFGVQLVGRILRVHRRLQGMKVPELLEYGYVLLADPEAQSGIDKAGQRINQIRTEFAKVAPTAGVLMTDNGAIVQIVGPGGQLSYTPDAPSGAMQVPVAPTDGETWRPQAAMVGYGELFGPSDPVEAAAAAREHVRRVFGTDQQKKKHAYPLRETAPRQFKTQERQPDLDIDEADCAEEFLVSMGELFDAVLKLEKVKVTQRIVEIFSGQFQTEFAFAIPSPEQCALTANRQLRQGGVMDPRILRAELERKLQILLAQRGIEDANDSEYVRDCLNVVLTTYPNLLADAKRRSLGKLVALANAEPLPAMLESDDELPGSTHNVYGRIPPGLDSWERKFVKLLDDDDTGTVLWWHRNESRNPCSVAVLKADGGRFFPDFVVGINGRPTELHALLADPKERFDKAEEVPKLVARHSAYGRAVILAKDEQDRWRVARFVPPKFAELGETFNMLDMAQFGLND